jgi:hypothetical protein
VSPPTLYVVTRWTGDESHIEGILVDEAGARQIREADEAAEKEARAQNPGAVFARLSGVTVDCWRWFADGYMPDPYW